jgi:hypothetical protein
MKDMLATALEKLADDPSKPTMLDIVRKKLGMVEPVADPTNNPFVQARQRREAEDATLLSGFMPYHTPKLVDAAKTTLSDWLATLPPHRLLHPFYMSEMQAIVAHRLAAQGKKKTKLSAHTIALALWSLGFQKRRDSGTTRPQTRYWLHPAAVAHQRTKKGNTK